MDKNGDLPYKAILSGVPNISKQKLIKKLEEVTDCVQIQLTYITKSSAKVSFSTTADLNRLLARGLDIAFGDKLYPVTVKKFSDQRPSTSGQMTETTGLQHRHQENTGSFLYQPPDKESKQILKYVRKTPGNSQLLQNFLRNYHFRLENITESEIEVQLVEESGSRASVDRCKQCLEEFFRGYSSWNEELPNCSKDDETFIIRRLKHYKSKCFGIWYTNTKTILATGPANIIEELKDDVLQRISQNNPREPSSPKKPASIFCYSDVPPGVLRFVSKQRSQELRFHMCKLAQVNITTNGKISSVQVLPILMTTSTWRHSKFEKTCTAALQEFFSKFQVWKESFDCALVQSLQKKRPEDFKEKSDMEHHIKWFLDTGTVNVSGVASAVQLHRQKIETMLGKLPQRQRFQSGSDREEESSITELPTTPRRRSRNVSSSSDEAAFARPESTYHKVSCSTEDIPRQVLLFVMKDIKTKKRFETCCSPNAKAVIRSEKIDGKDQICVYANFLPGKGNPKAELEAFKVIREFFDQFETQTKKHDVKKLRDLMATAEELFNPVSGEVHILCFPDTGTVKVTGVAEKVAEKHEEIEGELNSKTVVEKVDNADVFIAQRECGVWSKVERACKDLRLRVSVLSKEPGNVQFRGSKCAVTKAKKLLGELSEALFEKPLEGFSDEQINVLRKCEQSQKTFLRSHRNLLDAAYQHFSEKSVTGSLIFHDACISLISTDGVQWKNANDVLLQFVVSFAVEIGKVANVSPKKMCKAVKAKFTDDAVSVKEMHTGKLEIHCFASRKNEIMRKVNEVKDDVHESGKIETFHEMPEEKAKHFLNPHSQCKLYKAEKLEKQMVKGKHGLTVTCEKEDLDTVEMQLADLCNEIVCKSFHIPGYFLYETLQKSSRHFKIERDTNSSIFFHPTKQAHSEVKISVKHGNILDEKCDAIVNSTGNGLDFTSTSQVNKALKKKLGANVLKYISQSRTSLLRSKADIFSTSGLAQWSVIVNVATPNQRDKLTKFICELLEAMNIYKIQSLALPTVGTGNMGMDPATVAGCMKVAFEAFQSSHSRKFLKDVRVVVYDANLVSAFSDIAPPMDPSSSGIHTNMYANSSGQLEQASQMFQKLCEESVIKEVIHDPIVQEFSDSIKAKAREICKGLDVHLELTSNSVQDQCVLQGSVDEVRKAKDKIERLFISGPNWTPMTGKKPYEKVQLDPASSEYKAVTIKFKQSLSVHYHILKIERIQNPLQYQQFRARMTSKLAGDSNKKVSKQLFHGTTLKNADSICLYGFNRTYSGRKNGKLYGSGVYFHINASYSSGYATDTTQKCMFLADVITGEYTMGSSAHECAPINPKTGESFDSLVDNTLNPNIYVVFPDSSCYPSYLITFM